MPKKNIDNRLCLRVRDAFCSLPDENGNTLSQKAIAEKFGIAESVVSEISKCKREPSKALIGKVIVNCYAVDPAWLLVGKINLEACARVNLFMRCIEGNLKAVGKKLNVSTDFVLSTTNKDISPSAAFLQKLSVEFNAARHHLPKDR